MICVNPGRVAAALSAPKPQAVDWVKLGHFAPVSARQRFSAGTGRPLVLSQVHSLLEASGNRWGNVRLWQVTRMQAGS